MLPEGLNFILQNSKFSRIAIPSSYQIKEKTEEDIKKALLYDIGCRVGLNFDSNKSKAIRFLTGDTELKVFLPTIIKSFVYLIGGKKINPVYGEIINASEILIKNRDIPNLNLASDDLVSITNYKDFSSVYGENLEILEGSGTTSQKLTLKQPLEIDINSLASPYVKITNTCGKIIYACNHTIDNRKIYSNSNYVPIIEENVIIF